MNNNTNIQVVENWKKDLEVCRDIVSNLVRSRGIYLNVKGIVESNSKINYGNRYHDWVIRNYGESVIMGIRRLVDHDTRSVSLKMLLEDMRTRFRLLNRSWYVNQPEYRHIPLHTRNQSFDYIAGEGRKVFPLKVIQDDLKYIYYAKGQISTYVDKRVAHHDREEIIELIPTYKDVNDMIVQFEEMVIKYWVLLTGQSYTGLEPHVQYDWLDIFRVPWIEVSGV